MTIPKAKPYTLDCRHVLWLSHPPLQSDDLWCHKCQRYEPLFMARAREGEWFNPSGEYIVRREGQKYHGECLFQGCAFKYDSYSHYNALDNAMHSHYMRSHTKWKVTITKAPRLPPGSSPPF